MNEIFRPTGGLDVAGSQDVVAGGTATLLTVDVQTALELQLTHFGNDIADVTGWGFVTWDIKINGVAVPDFGALKDQYGTLSQPHVIGKEVSAKGGGVVTIDCYNGSAATQRISANLRGTFGVRTKSKAQPVGIKSRFLS